MTTNDITNVSAIKMAIYDFISKNYGEQEVDNPSWNVRELAKSIEKTLLAEGKISNEKLTYNGWTNYATWRVNLELLDGEADAIRESGEVFDTVADLADHLKQMIDDYFELNLGEIDPEANNYAISTMHSYANAFIDEVNFYEIAETMAQDNPAFVKELAQ